MSSTAIPHVIAFLTRPLLASFPAATVTSAQLILTASFASAPAMATFTLTSAAPPAPILAASLGACVPWAAWFAALAGNSTDTVLLFYGPGYVKVRVGDAPVKDVWSEEREGSVVRISRVKAVAPLLQESTGARLRAMLLSARVRNMRREQQALEIRLPSLLPASCTSLCSDTSDSDCDSDCESDSDRSTTSSSSTFSSASAESLTSAASSAPATPPKAACVALPASNPRGMKTASPRTKPAPGPTNLAKKDLTAYLYQGGVTRVMSGGVMLGARPVVKFKRS
ncbi:hypothetical protein FB451DRAFT_1561238 [Mycena latifolia]|nr:hypothetical protein FB451DRAFT_1561238 [Mycena latifolia]